MVIWLITVGEPLPTDQKKIRLLRTGLLAEMLVSKGHSVVWWTSTFNHVKKIQRFNTDTFVEISKKYKIILLYSISYSKNVSFRRLINHYGIAKKFRKLAELEEKPDVILCSFPTIDLSLEAVKIGGKKGIPVVLDVRDLWPDAFYSMIPKSVRWIGKILLFCSVANAKKAFSNCTSIIGISEAYVRWGLDYARRNATKQDTIFPLGYQDLSNTNDSQGDVESSLLKMRIDPSKMIIWFIGTFGRTCDLDVVIDAAHELKRRGFHDIQFVLSGDGERKAEWQERAEHLKNVRFTGWIQSDQIKCLMRFADVGLAAYKKNAPQGLPNKIFEYMCGGLPILSSLNGEAKELLTTTKCGLWYQPGNVESLIEALLVLKNDSNLLKQMGSNSLAVFKERFSADKIYNRMVSYLSDVVSVASSRSLVN